MNHLANLIKKELKELLTPASLIPVIAVMFLFIAMGSFVGGEISDKTSTQPIGYVNLAGDEGYAHDGIVALTDYYANVYKVDPKDYLFDLTSLVPADNVDGKMAEAMQSKGVNTAIVIEKDFNTHIQNWETERARIDIYYYEDTAGVFSSMNTIYGTQAVSIINKSAMEQLVEDNSTLTPEEIKKIESVCGFTSSTYLKGSLYHNITPDQIYSTISSQTTFIPLIIMLVIVMIGSVIISSIGNEKENKTLETLLTMPIKRTTIVTGKLIGSAIAGLVMCLFYMIGMYFYISGMSTSTGSSGITTDDLGMTLSVLDWAIVAVMMFMTIMCALGLCMLLGAFAKNYKTAQIYLAPISALAIIPMFVTMFSSFSSLPALFQALLFAIPFTHPMMVVQNLMFGNTSLVFAGLLYVIVFAVVIIAITVKVYNSDILITGLMKKKALSHKEGEVQ